MPTYEYECTACGYRFEQFQKMNDKPLTKCPRCGQTVKRLIKGGTGFILKGSGFYATDYKNSFPQRSRPRKTKNNNNPSHTGKGK